MLVEVKPGKCAFNGPWTNRQAGNLHGVLRAVGFVAPNSARQATDELYTRGRHTSAELELVLIALGNQVDDTLAKRLPGAQQITWEDSLRFIMHRFVIYHNQKAHHPQWDAAGKELFELATAAHYDLANFVRSVCEKFSIHPVPKRGAVSQ